MKRKCFLITMAAGHGSRMGSELPKQFLPLAGRAVLHTTISKFTEAVPGISVVTVLPQGGEYVEWWKRYCVENNFNCPQLIVNGGITRFHSVKAALSKIPDGATVAVQDGVRPLLSLDFIRAMFSRFEEDDCHALIPVMPVVDTLKKLVREEGNLVQATGPEPDRSVLFGAQTPQLFRSEDIRAAYGQAYDVSFTDDASVAARYGIPLTFCEGERLNFKLTTPEDMVLAEAVMKIRRKGI